MGSPSPPSEPSHDAERPPTEVTGAPNRDGSGVEKNERGAEERGEAEKPSASSSSSSPSSETDGASNPPFGAAGPNDGGDPETAGVTDRTLSRTTTRSSVGPGPPPDGGLKAWLASEF